MLNKKLAMYEFERVLNMYKYQEDLPKVFERIELKHFQPDNKIVAELFRSIAVLWRDQKQINEVTLEFKMAQFHKDSDANEKIINRLKINKTISGWEDDVNFIIYNWKRRELEYILDKAHKVSQKEDINFSVIESYIDKISEVLESNLHEEESIEDILTSQPIIEFKDHTMKRLFHGILRENINVIAGDTGHTKTTLTIFMTNEWLERGYRVLMFPVDGNYRETIQKLTSLRTQVNSNLIVESNYSKEFPEGRMTPEEYKIVKDEMYNIEKKFLKTKQLVIREKETELAEIKLWIRKIQPDIVIIDTIQGMEMPGSGEIQMPQHGIPIILKHLKQISKQVGCAIVLVAWMETVSKRPEPWQIWFSKAIVKWAAKIWMLYYFYKNQKIPAFKNIIEIIDGKQRFAETGIKLVSIKPEYGIYYELDVDSITRKNYAKLAKLPGGHF